MTEYEKNIVTFVEGKKELISPNFESKKKYTPEDEPGPRDLKITLRIPVIIGNFKDEFRLVLLRTDSVDACADAGAHRVTSFDIVGRPILSWEGITFLKFGQKKSPDFMEWLDKTFSEWYAVYERDHLKMERENYEKRQEEKRNWQPDKRTREILKELVKSGSF